MIEAVIVCHEYDDFLAYTLPLNKHHFDRLVVVTTPEDKATQRLAEYHHVECLQTDAFGIAAGEFRKGAAINVGMRRLSRKDWVVHMDADMVLPPETRGLLERAKLDKRMLYGIDRHTITGLQNWLEQVEHPRLQQEDRAYVHADAYPVATRFMWPQAGGYLPIGFFQLWHPATSGVHAYPEQHTSAGRTDMLFAMQWERADRASIPEFIGYHLESERAPQGANWRGRKTVRFHIAANGPIEAVYADQDLAAWADAMTVKRHRRRRRWHSPWWWIRHWWRRHHHHGYPLPHELPQQ